jgi:hypothetical protein
MELNIIIIIVITVVLAYQFGKNQKRREIEAKENEEYVKTVNAMLLKKYEDTIKDYIPVAGAKTKEEITHLVNYISDTIENFDYHIENLFEGILLEYELCINPNITDDEKIRYLIGTYIFNSNYSELIVWRMPPKEEVLNYETVRGFFKIESAYIAKEMLRRFLNIQSYVVSVNVEGACDSGSVQEWDVVVSSEHDADKVRDIYNAKFDEWIEELHKLDNNIKRK